MPSIFDVPLTGYRFVQTEYGETLQTFAARVLGDATNWAQLVALNGLEPPYLTDDPDSASATVILNGSFLMIPASTRSAATPDPNAVFGTDVLLSPTGQLSVVNGDFALVSGTENLTQALENAIDTDQGELIYHSSYGCLVRRLIGKANGPTAGQLAARYAKQTVSADPRVSNVTSATATVVGTAIATVVQAETIAGTKVPATNNL